MLSFPKKIKLLIITFTDNILILHISLTLPLYFVPSNKTGNETGIKLVTNKRYGTLQCSVLLKKQFFKLSIITFTDNILIQHISLTCVTIHHIQREYFNPPYLLDLCTNHHIQREYFNLHISLTCDTNQHIQR